MKFHIILGTDARSVFIPFSQVIVPVELMLTPISFNNSISASDRSSVLNDNDFSNSHVLGGVNSATIFPLNSPITFYPP